VRREADDEQGYVRTPHWSLAIPRVILLLTYERIPRPHVRFNRRNVFMRDHFTCQYCGKQLPQAQLNIDHVIPRSQGGATTWDNVVCSCIRCNLKKGGRSPAQAGLRLLHEPRQPRWTLLARQAAAKIHDSWLPFIGHLDA
jgi:5-methylcytosine-specific restriction endonuclease McrA